MTNSQNQKPFTSLHRYRFMYPLCLVLLLFSFDCPDQEPLFLSLPSTRTGITFRNQLTEDEKNNILRYEYFYNGGGVATGDLNNDGLDDIFFTANMEDNQLYQNLGDVKFKNMTKASGMAGKKNSWTTGVTMTDVNGDGLLDIYVCYSGKGDENSRRNELYINQGHFKFKESAAEYGLDDPSYSTQAIFFDYDKDGDYDMYLLNHNVKVIYDVEYGDAQEKRDPLAGDKLYENQDGHFTDVSEQAGIKGNGLGFGLGIAVSDVNGDSWPDIYVSNDYTERDYLYINQGNGTFKDQLTNYFQHISYFSMGSDVSDMNNDGKPDIFTLDMLPEDNERQKLLFGPENYEQNALMVQQGFFHQNMRNMLQLNNGMDQPTGDSLSQGDFPFSEIGQLAGISNTDWSWAPLFADFDNDGWKDLFITNGYYRDYTNRDFLKYKGDYYFQMAVKNQKADTFDLVNTMTSTPVHNYVYRNNHDLSFDDMSECWGVANFGFSNGAAYSDLDNDGDLDLIVNNINEKASIYQNQTREKYPDRKALTVRLEGQKNNQLGLGTQLFVYTPSGTQYYEQMPTRGFQSSVSPVIHVGLGDQDVDSLKVVWPSGKTQLLTKVSTDKPLTLKEKNADKTSPVDTAPKETIFTQVASPVNYQHQEYTFNDFKRQPLLMTMLTTCGPILATGDINGDQQIDVFAGGAKGTLGKLFAQAENCQFAESAQTFEFSDQLSTDADALFFDADGDGDQDLYIASGGFQDYRSDDLLLQDRLYLNDGQGNFTPDKTALPAMRVSKSCIAPADYDQDGDIDLFVGGRVIPGEYPKTPESFLLENDGTGHFTQAATLPALNHAGMVTDATWADLDGDGKPELIVVGEFMPIEVFAFANGKATQVTSQYFDKPLSGLWNKLLVKDFDEDGDMDLLVGNFGLNSQLKVSDQEPLEMVYQDFDQNGSVDPILTYYIDGVAYPFPSRDELLDQIISMRKKFTSYESYADARLNDLFTQAELDSAHHLKATTLETMYLENKDGQLISHSLPPEAQFAPVYAMTALDYNEDGHLDFVIAGNQSAIRIRMGSIDANYGQLFEGDGAGNFRYIPQSQSGLKLQGDIKSLETLKLNGETYLLAGINNQGVTAYKIRKKP